jgi:hypothetical protein
MFRVSRPAVLLIATSLLAGCNAASSTARYVPTEKSAREALETALDNWKSGKPPGDITDRKPPISISDSVWKSGKKLASYEITTEETNAEGHHRFTVKLTMNPTGAIDTHYVVFGDSPIWVCSEEDYAKLSGKGK